VPPVDSDPEILAYITQAVGAMPGEEFPAERDCIQYVSFKVIAKRLEFLPQE
jgi:hypothetical protein